MEGRGAEQAEKVGVVCQVIMAGVCISVALYLLEPVLVPLVLAVFFSQALQPMLAFLTQRTRLPSSVAVFLAMLTLCFFFIAAIFATIHRCSPTAPLIAQFDGIPKAQTSTASSLGSSVSLSLLCFTSHNPLPEPSPLNASKDLCNTSNLVVNLFWLSSLWNTVSWTVTHCTIAALGTLGPGALSSGPLPFGTTIRSRLRSSSCFPVTLCKLFLV